MPTFKLVDLRNILIYWFLYTVCLCPLFLILWFLDQTTVFEYTQLISLAGVAALLTYAQKLGFFPLVLGLCCLFFWIKVEPLLALYLLIVSSLLYALLHWTHRHQRLLFWICLLFFIGLLPKLIPMIFPAKPLLWLWFRESLFLGFFLRYWMFEREWQAKRISNQRFFEHLGYILFIPQLLKLVLHSPPLHFNEPLIFPKNIWSASRSFGLGTLKLLVFQLHLILPLGLQEHGAASFAAAWYQIVTSTLLWVLWFSAHCDYAVSLGRLLGIQLPLFFNFPLLAISPKEFWQRWLVLHHDFLRIYLYLPLGGRAAPLRAITGTFLISALLFSGFWIGSSSWLPTDHFWKQWLPFFAIQALLVYVFSRFNLITRSSPLWLKTCGFLFTQLTFALCALLLVGLNRYPGDSLTPAHSWVVMKSALFLD